MTYWLCGNRTVSTNTSKPKVSSNFNTLSVTATVHYTFYINLRIFDVFAEKGFYTYFATMICHFALCTKLKEKLFLIHHFWRRLLTRIILLAGHTTGHLADFITVSSPDFGLNLCTVNN